MFMYVFVITSSYKLKQLNLSKDDLLRETTLLWRHSILSASLIAKYDHPVSNDHFIFLP